MSKNEKLIFILGPTAVGKSSLALELAQKYEGVILNADSVQVYRGLDIGTAKPSAEEQQLVPHLLFDCVSAPNTLTAGQYHDLARSEIARWWGKKPIFVVGGSGFYVQALEKGLYPAPRSHPEVVNSWQRFLQDYGPEALHQELLKLDPEYAARLAVSDSYRIIRALALVQQTQKTMRQIQDEFREIQKKTRLPWPYRKVGLTLSRERLRARVRVRVMQMKQMGLADEVRGLLEQGLESWPPMKSVGYKETVAMVSGALSEAAWLESIETSTMQLAKKQMTWFKRDTDLLWFQADTEWDLAKAKVEEHLLTEL